MYPRVLVTGGSGFIGTNVIEFLRRQGTDVLNLDIVAPRCPDHMQLWCRGDMLKRDLLERILGDYRPTAIVHLAARTDLDETASIDDYAVNFKGTENLISAIRSTGGVQRCLFASSMLVCRNGYVPRADTDVCPDTVYGRSKVAQETIVRSNGIECSWAIIRPTSIWGPWFGAPYLSFFKAAANGVYVHPKGHSGPKALGYVENTVFQLLSLLRAATTDIHGRTFYLTDYTSLAVVDWARMIGRAAGAHRVIEVPLWGLKIFAALGECYERAFGTRAPLTPFRLRNILTYSRFDCRDLARLTGPLPFSTEDGVTATLEWMRAHGYLH